MTQNIYDDPTFFDNYAKLRRSVEGLDGAPEWPALRALLPEPRGLRIADLGCGYGWFCRWAAEHEAASVLGLDVSERMLERARADTTNPRIAYRRADLERLDLPAAAFDLVYSSLAFHYIENLPGLFAAIHRALVPDGRLVFSIEHPILTAPSRQGFRTDAEGWRHWPLDGYQRRPARDRLARQGRGQAASHHRHPAQPADRIGLRARAPGRMGAVAGPGRGAAGAGRGTRATDDDTGVGAARGTLRRVQRIAASSSSALSGRGPPSRAHLG